MSKNIEIKRMTGTMRIVHWVTFFSMITAVITGFPKAGISALSAKL